MTETNKIHKMKYYYNMIPDIGYVEWYERKYLVTVDINKNYTSPDGLFSHLKNLPDNNIIDTNSYRVIILSDEPLELANNQTFDIIFQKLSNYSGRYVYLGIASDIDIYHQTIKVMPEGSNTLINISVLRF